VLRPFLAAVLWGVVLVVATWPAFERLTALMGGRRTLAAVIATALLALVLVGPLVIVGSRLAGNLADLAALLRNFLDHGMAAPAWLARIPLAGPTLAAKWQQFIADDRALRQLVNAEIRPLTLWLLGVFGTLGAGLLQVALAVFCAFFFYLGGPAGVGRGRNILRHIVGDRADRLITVAHLTMRGVVFGVLGAAAVQAVLAGLGFWAAGMPRPLLLAVATFFAGIVPNATFLVLVPATVWAFYGIDTGWAIALLVWNLGIVGQVDNFIRPMVIARGTSMPILLVLFGVIGGLGAFGFLGLFLGPTLLALLYTLMLEWSPDRARE
jgi:predicted PurR-regulated permease PerM